MNQTTIGDHFECKYCHRTYKREDAYLRHRCKRMVREEEMQTVLGHSAWLFYGSWMRAQRRLVPKIQTFLTSNFYTSFMKFAQFVKDVQITEPDIFIKMMVDRDISPTMWTNNIAYAYYLEYIERKLSPMDQMKISLKVLLKLADGLDCDISEVFEQLMPNEIIQLIRDRKLTPWLLLNSHSFGVFFRKLSPPQRKIIEALIRPEYWSHKFTKDPILAKKMKAFVQNLNI